MPFIRLVSYDCKFNQKTSIYAVTKKDNPREYWIAIAFRIFFVLFALFVGYKLFF